MKITSLVLALTCFSSMAVAAPSITCTNVDKSDAVEGLKLSADGKEIVRIAPRADIVSKLIIGHVKVLSSTDVAVVGTELSPLMCAGSCGPRTFELRMSAREISPNSSLVTTHDYFDESLGERTNLVQESRFDCAFANLEEIGRPVVPSVGSPTIQSVSQFTNMMPPTRSNAIVTSINFDYVACATFSPENFDVSVEKKGSAYALSVSVKPGTIDCMGIGRLRSQKVVTFELPIVDSVLVNQGGVLVDLPVQSNIVH